MFDLPGDVPVGTPTAKVFPWHNLVPYLTSTPVTTLPHISAVATSSQPVTSPAVPSPLPVPTPATSGEIPVCLLLLCGFQACKILQGSGP